MIIREISPEIRQLIADKHMFVLRRKRDNVALNVSYSRDGLKWTSNKLGRCLMFKRAFVRNGRIEPVGDYGAQEATDVYTERFVPSNHDTESAQVAEYT